MQVRSGRVSRLSDTGDFVAALDFFALCGGNAAAMSIERGKAVRMRDDQVFAVVRRAVRGVDLDGQRLRQVAYASRQQPAPTRVLPLLLPRQLVPGYGQRAHRLAHRARRHLRIHHLHVTDAAVPVSAPGKGATPEGRVCVSADSRMGDLN